MFKVPTKAMMVKGSNEACQFLKVYLGAHFFAVDLIVLFNKIALTKKANKEANIEILISVLPVKSTPEKI